MGFRGFAEARAGSGFETAACFLGAGASGAETLGTRTFGVEIFEAGVDEGALRATMRFVGAAFVGAGSGCTSVASIWTGAAFTSPALIEAGCGDSGLGVDTRRVLIDVITATAGADVRLTRDVLFSSHWRNSHVVRSSDDAQIVGCSQLVQKEIP